MNEDSVNRKTKAAESSRRLLFIQTIATIGAAAAMVIFDQSPKPAGVTSVCGFGLFTFN